MYQHTYSASLCGLEGIPLEVECYIGGGLPGLTIVGIPASSAIASRERIRGALKNAGFTLPASRIIVNIRALDAGRQPALSECGCLDLPIALSILACDRQIPPALLEHTLWMGELSLSGRVKPLLGALTIAKSVSGILPNFTGLYYPFENAPEAALSPAIPVYAVPDLLTAIEYLRHHLELQPVTAPPLTAAPILTENTFNEIRGQNLAKRVITIAAAGMHNALLIGPPGCGKTMLSRTLPFFMPPLTLPEQLELTEIYSCLGELHAPGELIRTRPFRAPHHTISTPALVGGGSFPRPGEVTLAHHGILFLDELPELSRPTLEALREPLEEHQVHVTRLSRNVLFPADFLFIAGMNPCPCGFWPDRKRCRCSASALREYYRKIDSPLMDRIDLILQMEAVKPDEIDQPSGLTFEKAKALAETARARQKNRYHSETLTNSRVPGSEIEGYCRLSESGKLLMREAIPRYSLSMRAYHKVLKTARTIADMEDLDAVRDDHLLEAIQYRADFTEQLAALK